jgi:hypothetical protein
MKIVKTDCINKLQSVFHLNPLLTWINFYFISDTYYRQTQKKFFSNQ